MTVYKLDYSEDIMRVEIDIPTMMRVLGGFNFVLDGTPRLPIWQTFDAQLVDTNGPVIPDISVWQCNPCFNEKTHNALSESLSDYGEFLPVNIDGERWYIFNITHTIEADPLQSEKKIHKGKESSYVERIGFNPTPTDLIFKTPYDGHMGIYCQQALVDMFSQFTGPQFSKELSMS